ncbi:marine proteobacterial sortase target protein [Candidatus Pseudothioglobus singularis]|nr:marine proteobacterial sortase target protein [Candidatus Pseudothioglobus singularis]MDB4847007.1 marine proteobacterial sortase target protein [Candidatus Pseudothioglobus singularis]
MTRLRPNPLFKLIFSIFLLLATNLAIASSHSQDKHSNPVNEAESGSMIFKFDDNTSFMQIALDTKVQMDITGNINRVIVEQVFTNPSDMWAEGVYVFPLPEDSAVDHLRMYIDERVIEGQIKEKEEAKKIYEKAKSEGKSASLVEQQRPNIFTTKVANIAPGGTIKVAIEYQQGVIIENNRYSIRFPMVVGDRYIPGTPTYTPEDSMGVSNNTIQVGDASEITPISENHVRELIDENFETYLPVTIDINLSPGFDLASLNSTYHKINTESLSQMTKYITLAEASQLDRDFELTWSANMSHEPEVALFAQENDNSIYLMLMAIPPKNDVFKKSQRPRELIFIIDSSGSMSGSSIKQAKDSLNAALKRLNPSDRFNIIDFDSGFEPLYESAMPATNSHLNEAKRFIKKIDADGGTEMLAPIKFALKSRDSDSKNYLRQIVFITDGQSGNEGAIFNTVEFDIENDRFFTIGIGSAPNSYLLTKLADFGRGAFTYIGSQKEVSQKMNRLFEKLESPALTDIKVQFPPEINAELAKDVIYDLYAGETITAAFKMNALPNSLQITGKTVDGDFNKNIIIDTLESTKGIDIFWARRKIDRLTDIHDNAYTTRIEKLSRKDITDLALDYHLVSRFTSLVAVDISPVRPESEKLINQAIIKKAKADGMEDEIRIDSDGNLQNRDDLLQEFIAKLSTQKSSAARSYSAKQSAYKAPLDYESALMSELLAELEIAEFEAELRAELTLNSSSPVKLAQASQTATYSELLMYIGLSLLLFAFVLRRRLAI